MHPNDDVNRCQSSNDVIPSAIHVAAACETSARLLPALRALRAALEEKSPDRPLPVNVEFWAAVVLDVAEIPPELTPAMFGCARVAGWSAHIVEQRRTGRLIRPSARYVGVPAHSLAEA